MKLGNYCILHTDRKILQKTSIKVWLTLFRNGEPHRFRLDLTDKLNLEDPKKNMALTNLSIYYTCKNIKSE